MLSGLRGRLEPPKKSHRWPQLNQAAAEGPNELAADQARSPSLSSPPLMKPARDLGMQL
jgi:hypothetical protein